jgi:hypothetical protein
MMAMMSRAGVYEAVAMAAFAALMLLFVMEIAPSIVD